MTKYQQYKSYYQTYVREYNRKWTRTLKGKQSVRATYEKRYAIRVNIINKAKNQPCTDCKKTFPSYVMDLDHVRGKKLFEIGSSKFAAFKRLHAEIAKCDVVCSNCHRLRTFGGGEVLSGKSK